MTAPFGIEFGIATDQLKILQAMDQGISVIEPAKPHPLLEKYIIQATPLLGVVWIKGIGPNIENDIFGTATKTAVDRLADQVSQKYGRGKKTDLLLDGSIWTEPQEWMHGLDSNQRLYNYVWDRKIQNLPDDIENIFVGAVPQPINEASVVIEYSSVKLVAAQRELDKLMADLL
jgi:hypothetical protein